MSVQSNIYNVSDLVDHYHNQDLYGSIKIFFRKSDIKTHNSKLDKPFYVIKPLVVKVGYIFDDHPNFSVFLKPKYNYRINLIENDIWVMEIDDNKKTFQNNEGFDVNFHDVTLKYITNSKLIDQICMKALATHNIEEFNEEL